MTARNNRYVSRSLKTTNPAQSNMTSAIVKLAIKKSRRCDQKKAYTLRAVVRKKKKRERKKAGATVRKVWKAPDTMYTNTRVRLSLSLVYIYTYTEHTSTLLFLAFNISYFARDAGGFTRTVVFAVAKLFLSLSSPSFPRNHAEELN